MKRTTLIVILLTLILGVGLCWAQTNTPPAPAPGINVPLSSIPVWLQLLITPITLALASAVRKYLPAVKPEFLPFIVPFVGAGINILSDLIGLWGSQGLMDSALAGAALGALATWLHQIGKQSGVVAPSDE